MGLLGHLAGAWGRNRKAAALALDDVRFTVLDTELTGLDPRQDAIVSIGAVRMIGGRIRVGGAFHQFVNPATPLDGSSVVIHRILPSQVASMPPIAEVLPPFLDYLGDSVLAGHCLAVDLGFLDRDARALGRGPLRQAAVDTLSIYGWLRKRHHEHPAFRLPLPGLSLFQLAQAFEIPVEQAHSALADAYLTAQLLQRFLPMLQGAGVTHLASLLRIADPHRQAQNLFAAESQVQF